MTELMRVKTKWSGFSGGPGYTVLHFRDMGSGDGGGGPIDVAAVNGALTRANTFFAALKALFPATATLQVEAEVDVIEDTTGELLRSISGTAPAPTVGTSVAVYSAAVGAVVNWRTAGVRNGRRVRGRTFLVPMTSAAFNNSGVIVPGTITLIQNAANALADRAGTPDLMVYARPSGPGATDGVAYVVNSTSVPSSGAILRSRRD